LTGTEKENVMKKARTLVVTPLLLFAVSICTHAQDHPLVKANIPFAFDVRNATLPDGTYYVTGLGLFENAIKVQSVDGRKSVIVMAPGIVEQAETGQSRLVFQRIGDKYFLAQVWVQGSSIHRDVPKGKLEIELAKKVEKSGDAVILASNTR
jgi:hypothetical protein